MKQIKPIKNEVQNPESPEKVKLVHPATKAAKEIIKFLAQNVSISPAIAVSAKKFPLSFTIRFPLSKFLKKMK